MASTQFRGSGFTRAVLMAVTLIVALMPIAASAEYPLPIAGDEYAIVRSIYTNAPGLGQYVADGFTVDHDGNVWTVEYDYNSDPGDYVPARLAKYSPDGVMLAQYSSGLGLRYPLAVKLSPNGLLYIADAGLNLSTTDDAEWNGRPGDGRIIIVDPTTGVKVGQLPTDGQPGPSNLSTTTEAMDRFKCPVDIDFAADGTYAVTDYAYNRVVGFDSANLPQLAVGSITPGTGDTDFNHPTGSFVATDGALWVVDSNNARVQRFSVEATEPALLNSYSSGFTGAPEISPGVYDQLNWPHDVHIDTHGVVYVSDWGGSGDRFVRFTQNGEWLGGYRDTGAPPAYSVQIPWDIYVDDAGAVWMMDYGLGLGVFDGAIRAFGLNPGEPDVTPPATTSDAPASWVPGPRSIHLSAADASTTVAATYYSTDGSFPSVSYVDSITVSAEGTTTIQYFSVDRVGNAEGVVSQDVFIDSTPPTTTASVETTYYGSAYIPFSAIDELSGVQTTWFFVDAAGPYTDPAAVSTQQGPHLLRYFSVDHAGNIEQTRSFVFTVRPPDSDPPQTTWSERRDVWFTENTQVTLVATDSVSGVLGTLYSLGGSDWTTYTAPVPVIDEGTHELEYYSVDLLGHRESTQTGTIRLDKTSPETVAEIPAGAIGSGVVTLTASDAISGVQRTEWRFAQQADFTEGTVIALPTWGTYEIIFRSIDNAGNFEDVHNIEVTIERPDQIPPTTSSNVPANGWVRGTPLRELVLIASDYEGGSGVSETVLSVNGGPWEPYVPGSHFFPEGQYEIRYYSVDMQENHEEIHTEILRVDATPPTSWSDAQTFYAGPAQINLYTQDNTSSALTRYRLDGGPEILGSQILLSEYRGYTLEYWSVDGAGNEELPHHTINIAVAPPDTTPPVTSITAPSGWQKGYATFSLSAWDASSTIASTNFVLDDGWPQPYFSAVSITQEGTTVVGYWSTDTFNNREATKTAEVYVDASAPITTSNAVSSYTDVAPIVLTPTDPYSGVASTKYRINGGAWQDGTSFSVLWSRWRRYHTVEWYSTDAVGNIETKKSATFEVKLNPNPYPSSDSRIVYRGPWTSGFGGDARVVASGPSWALVAFQGTQLDLAARRAPDQGIMRASVLDTDIAPVEFDLWSDNDRDGTYNPPAYSTGFLEYNDYIVKFEWTGNGSVNIDDIRVEGVLATVPDAEAPITTVTAPTGWVNGPVSVTLSSTDATTGVKGTYATSNGTTPTTSNPYTGPILVTAEGATTIRYFSDDNRGNVEPVKNATVYIDNTAPSTSLGTAQRSFTATTTFSLLPVDALSGVGTSYWRLNGGSWNATTTVTIPGSSLGDHLLEWYSVDAIGNRETTRSASVTVFKRYEQTDSAILRRGTWSTATHDNHSSSTALQTTASGSMIYVPFTGTRIDVIGSRGPAYGQARVRVDGGTPVVVDLYAGTTQYRSTLASMTALAPGFHVLTIEALSTKNAASGGYTVMFDAADIVGTITPDTTAPTTTDSISPDWATTGQTVTLTPSDATYVTATKYRVKSGTWTTYTAPFAVASEGESLVEYYSTDLAGNVETIRQATVRRDTTAPSVSHDAPPVWTQGPVVVHLDADDTGSGLDSVLYSLDGTTPSIQYADHVVVDAQGITTLSYRAIDVLGNASAVATVAVMVDNVAPVTTDDAPAGWVNGPVDVTLDADDEHSGVVGIRYSLDGGTETTYVAPVAISGDGSHTIEYFAVDAAGNVEDTRTVTVLLDATAPDSPATVAAVYRATTVVDLAATDPVSGVASTQWRLDGGPWSDGSSATLPQDPGRHLLEWRSTDFAGNVEATRSAYYMMYIRLEQSHPDIAYKGEWYSVSNSSLSAGSMAKTSFSGTAASLSFRGTAVEWRALRSPRYGQARVRLDDGSPVNVDLYSPDNVWQDVVWSAEGLEDATHTVVIEWTGLKNAASLAPDLNIDAFDIAGPSVADSIAPSTACSASGTWRATSEVVSLTATDQMGFVAATRYRINGGALIDYTSPFTVSAEGTNTIEFYSIDGAGNTEATKTAIVRIDRTLPSITDDAPLAWTRGPLTVRLSAQDAGSGVWLVLYSCDGGTPSIAYPGNGIAVAAEGTTTLKYKVIDKVGNSSEIRTTLVRIDNTAPTSSDDAPEAWQNSPVTVALSSADALSGSSRIDYSIEDSAFVSYSTPVTLSEHGVHSLRYFATDSAGNAESTRTATIRIDTIAPDTSATVLPSYLGTSTVTLDAADADSGVATTQWRIDEGPWETGATATLPSGAGLYTLFWRSTDAAGNVETTRAASYTMYDRYEQTASAITYRGEWYRVDNASLSNGSMAKTTFSGTGAFLSFRGTGIDWIGLKSPGYGKALVSLDDGQPQIVDLYSPSPTWKAVIWGARGLQDTTHTVRIEWTGLKNDLATTLALNIDAFDVAGDLVVDQAPPVTTSSADGAWTNSNQLVTLTPIDSESFVAATRYSINGGNATTYTTPFMVTTEGQNRIEYSSVDGRGNRESTRTAYVRIDRTAPTVTPDVPATWSRGTVSVSLAATDTPSGVSSVLFSTDGGAPSQSYSDPIAVSSEGTTHVRFLATDFAGNHSAAGTATVLIDNSPPVSTDNAVEGWSAPYDLQILATDGLSGVDETIYSVNGGALATYTAPLTLGDGIHQVSYLSGDRAGNVESTRTAEVRIDSLPPTTTSTIAPSYSTTVAVSLTATDTHSGVSSTEWRIDGGPWQTGSSALLPSTPGRHALEWRSTDVVGNVEPIRSASYDMYNRIEQTDSRIGFRGNWGRIDNAMLSESSMMKTTFSNTSAHLAFKGTGVSLIALRSPGYGYADVVLDGGPPQRIDLYAPTNDWKAQVWSATGLADTTHTVAVVWTGAKNPNATTVALNVDAFDVAGTIISDTLPPVTTSSATGAWRNTNETVTLSSTDADGFVASTAYRINGSATTTYAGPFVVSAAGDNLIEFFSIDGVGNRESTRTARVRIDRNAPAVSHDAPSQWSSEAVTLTLSAQDAESGLDRITFSTTSSLTTNIYSSPLRISAEGPTTVWFAGHDIAGNSSSLSQAVVRIDQTAPSTTHNVPTGSWAAPFSLSLVSTDTLSGVQRIDYALDGSEPTTYSAPVAIGGGSHTVSFSAVDVAGNYETTHTIDVAVDATAPVTTANVQASYFATGSVTLTPTDSDSGVSATEWRIDSGQWQSGTSVILPLDPGRHTLSWRSVDAVGNVESTNTSAYEMFGRVEQNDSRVYYMGEWFQIDNTNLSGANMLKTTFPGTSAYVSFKGTAFHWVALKSARYGIATVSLDGGPAVDVDLFDPTALWKQRVWSATGLSDATHTVEISWTGRKNPSATANELNIDAFDISGQLVPFSQEASDSSSKLGYDSSWFEIANPSLSGGTMRKSVSTGTATLVFRGTGFDYYALKSPRYGFAEVKVDGTSTAIVDLYSPSSQWQQKVHSVSGLKDATHTVTIAWTGAKNASAIANEVNVDHFTVRGLVQQHRPRYEETNSKLWFGPDWQSVNSVFLSAGSMRKVDEPDSPAFISFKGTGIDLIALKTRLYGMARVKLDDQAPVLIDLYAPTDEWQSRVWSATGLTDTTHTVLVEWTGQKNAASLGTAIGIDGVDVIGSLLTASPTIPVHTRFEQSSPGVQYTPGWFNVNSFNVSGGTLLKSDSVGDVAYVSFKGTALKWIGVKTPSYGIARVTLDGGSPSYVDQYSATDVWKAKLYAVSGLEDATHTVKIEWTGAKNPASSGTAIAVDAFDIIGSLTPAVGTGPRLTRSQETSSAFSYAGAWTPVTSSFLSGGAARKATDASSSVTMSFTGTEFSWIGLKSTSYGIADVSVDGGSPTSIDLYAPTDQWKSQLFTAVGLTPGPHSVTIRVTGSKNPSSTGTAVLLDAADVMPLF